MENKVSQKNFSLDLKHNDKHSGKRLQSIIMIYQFLKENPCQNIVPILDIKKQEGKAQLKKGETDFEKLQGINYGNEISAKNVLLIFAESSKGLQFLHKRLLMHNDFKLNNVVLIKVEPTFYNPSGLVPVIIDFQFTKPARLYKFNRGDCQLSKSQFQKIEKIQKLLIELQDLINKHQHPSNNEIMNPFLVDSSSLYSSKMQIQKNVNSSQNSKSKQRQQIQHSLREEQDEINKVESQCSLSKLFFNLGKREYPLFGLQFLKLYLKIEGKQNYLKQVYQLVNQFLKVKQVEDYPIEKREFKDYVRDKENTFLKKWKKTLKIEQKVVKEQIADEIIKACSNLFISNYYMRTNLTQFRKKIIKLISQKDQKEKERLFYRKRLQFYQDLYRLTQLTTYLIELEDEIVQQQKISIENYNPEVEIKIQKQIIDLCKKNKQKPLCQEWLRNMCLFRRQIQYFEEHYLPQQTPNFEYYAKANLRKIKTNDQNNNPDTNAKIITK